MAWLCALQGFDPVEAGCPEFVCSGMYPNKISDES
jgi:hypothetical protein